MTPASEDIEIKVLTTDHLDQVRKLFMWFQEDDGVKNPSTTSDEYLLKILAQESFHVVAALMNDAIIGGLTAYELVKYKTEASEMMLYEIGVEESLRRQGIGKRLVSELISICKSQGITEMFVPTHRNNLASTALFKSMGGIADELSIIYDYPHI